jgi:hypothetical protein
LDSWFPIGICSWWSVIGIHFNCFDEFCFNPILRSHTTIAHSITLVHRFLSVDCDMSLQLLIHSYKLICWLWYVLYSIIHSYKLICWLWYVLYSQLFIRTNLSVDSDMSYTLNYSFIQTYLLTLICSSCSCLACKNPTVLLYHHGVHNRSFSAAQFICQPCGTYEEFMYSSTSLMSSK